MHSKQSLTPLLEAEFAIAGLPDESKQQVNIRSTGVRQPRTLRGTAARVARFLLHFLEMVIAMGIGMAIFAPVKGSLISQGYTALLDTRSLDYLVWMNLFMVVPMVLWMRVRGCSWRDGAEMSAAMIVPTACVLLLCGLGVSDVLPWFTPRLTGPAMFVGMFGIMLYRREMYTRSYSLSWPRWGRVYSSRT